MKNMGGGSRRESRRPSGNLLADLEATIRDVRLVGEPEDNSSTTKASQHDDDEDGGDDGPPPTPFRQFLDAINPIDVDEFKEMSWYNKIYEIAKV